MSTARRAGDVGREAVYAAELAAFDGTLYEAITPLAELVDLASRVTASSWWPHGSIDVVAARSDARSSSTRQRGAAVPVIRLAAGQMTPATVLHELAHVLAGLGAGHGPTYRRAYLDLVGFALGPTEAGWLREQFDAARLAVAERQGWPAPSGPADHEAIGGAIAL